MSLIAATQEQFAEFLSRYGYPDPSESVLPLLAMSFAFTRTLPFCSDQEVNADVLVEAQCFIAYSISAAGGGFSPNAVADARIKVEEGLGRTALVDKWKVNEQLIGTEPIDLLKKLPLAYGLLKGFLCTDGCSHGDSEGNGGIHNIELCR